MDKDKLRSEGDINITGSRLDYWESNIDEETNKLLEMDNKYFLHQSLSTPCLNVMESCKGSMITDTQGRTYLDFHGNNVHQVGFGNEAVIKAITKQMEELPFCTRRYTNKPAIELAKKLTELAPGDLNRVLFAPSGSIAIGMALKLARFKTGRFKTISMWDSFHGASLDAISVGGEAVFRSEIGPLLPGTEHVPPPDAQNCPWDCAGECKLKCADYIEYVLEKEGDVGAVIAETVRSTPFIPPKEYWQKVRAACDRHGALLILDEIPHCLGRTGAMFTVENYGIVPDMLVIGKGLGGGIFPLAALIAREDLNVMQDRALGHYTHEKSPVACAAALAAIKYVEDENIIDHVKKIGEYALEGLKKLKSKYKLIKDVRGIGLLIGVELSDMNGKKAVDEAEKMMYMALERGMNFKLTMGNILTLSPALTISFEEMDQALNILDSCFEEISEKRA
ncbi:aspartate aminotransferase family protein [Reichenbachiella sp. MALMAid0571]|uniref:(R)-1-hydroxy-2-aminoethylphosphonate ammonia-lyase n=1 Tax=Reichenbachiella sp. MALMAid0571 TaxID=3143939 RepID=UPI0032DF422F